MKKKKPTLKDKLSTLELENKILKAKIEAYEKSLELIGINAKQQTYTIPYNPPLTDKSPYTPYPNTTPTNPGTIPWYPQTWCVSNTSKAPSIEEHTMSAEELLRLKELRIQEIKDSIYWNDYWSDPEEIRNKLNQVK